MLEALEVACTHLREETQASLQSRLALLMSHRRTLRRQVALQRNELAILQRERVRLLACLSNIRVALEYVHPTTSVIRR